MFINDLKTSYDENTNSKSVSSEMDSEKVAFLILFSDHFILNIEFV